MKKIGAALLLAAVMMALLAPACLAQEDYSGVTLRIAQQYGMQYAPVYVVQKLNLLDKYLPGVQVEWSNLGGGSAMNEAMISGQLDIAFMGIPPVLIAWDKGVDYRIACGICVPPSELIVRDESINSLADLTAEDKIAVPGVGSIQHIMLSMAALKQLGDANALDNNIVTMANPDAYAALISGSDVAGHFASMPYIDLELEAGMKSILSAQDAYEQQASIVCVASQAVYAQSDVYEGLLAALEEAISLLNALDEQVISIVAETEQISEEDAGRYLTWEGTIYSSDVYGLMGLAQFMQENGFIENTLESMDGIAYPSARAPE